MLVLIGYGVGELLVTRPRSREDGARWTQRFCRRVLRVLGIAVSVEGTFPGAGVLLCNHQTYLDIAVLASLQPSVFVSKAEVATWPVVGWMTKRAGTVFVERGRGGRAAAAAGGGMLAAAEAGVPVVVFPEGTTSNGDGLLPFRGGLLAEARAGHLQISAATIRYALSGPEGATRRDDVAYWGDRGLLEHVARFLTLEGVAVRVRVAGAPLQFRATERKAAAVEAREQMLVLLRGAIDPVTSSRGVPSRIHVDGEPVRID